MGRKSKYDEHFEISNDKATCKRCGEVIKRPNRATTGMQYHLSSQHSITPNGQKDDTETSSPAAKKAKIDESCNSSVSNQKNPMDRYVVVTSKMPIEDLVAREAVKGATFKYIASSFLIYKGLCSLGFQDQAPRHHYSVSRLVKKSAENHRAKICEHLKSLATEKGQRFCVVTDEWTCSGKKRRYINVTLHLKGIFKKFDFFSWKRKEARRRIFRYETRPISLLRFYVFTKKLSK